MKTPEKKSYTPVILFWSVPSYSTIKAYKEKCSKLSQAISEQKEVQIVTNNNESLKLNEIGIQSGTFFGIETIKGKMEKMFLNLNNIKSVTLI